MSLHMNYCRARKAITGERKLRDQGSLNYTVSCVPRLHSDSEELNVLQLSVHEYKSYAKQRVVSALLVCLLKTTSKMPKVSKKDAKEQAALQPVPMVMDADDDNQPSTSGAKNTTKFPPLSVFDQNGRKIDFRRVSCKTNQQSLCSSSKKHIQWLLRWF